MGFSMHMYINKKGPIFMLIMPIVEGERAPPQFRKYKYVYMWCI